jgi:hypothetical protein
MYIFTVVYIYNIEERDRDKNTKEIEKEKDRERPVRPSANTIFEHYQSIQDGKSRYLYSQK